MGDTRAVLLPARYYAAVIAGLQQQGLDVDDVLRQADIAPTELNKPGATLTVEQVERVMHLIVSTTGNSGIGLLLGQFIKLSAHDTVGFAMLSSPSLGYSVQLIARFFRLITPTYTLRTRRTPAQFIIDIAPALSMSALSMHVHLDAILAALHDHVQVLLGGPPPPYTIEVSFPEPAYAAAYAAALSPARIAFGALPRLGARIISDASLADAPLALADSQALQRAEARCEALLRHVTQTGNIAAWVKLMLEDSSEGLPSLSELAHILHVSERTLERHLAREGTRFSSLLRTARLQRAQALLREPGVPITEIALLLGYTDSANFSRAFKRDTGLSPTAYRHSVTSAPT